MFAAKDAVPEALAESSAAMERVRIRNESGTMSGTGLAGFGATGLADLGKMFAGERAVKAFRKADRALRDGLKRHGLRMPRASKAK